MAHLNVTNLVNVIYNISVCKQNFFFLPPAIANINRGPEGVRCNGSWLYFLLSYTGNIPRGMSIHIIFISWRDSNVPDVNSITWLTVFHCISCESLDLSVPAQEFSDRNHEEKPPISWTSFEKLFKDAFPDVWEDTNSGFQSRQFFPPEETDEDKKLIG